MLMWVVIYVYVIYVQSEIDWDHGSLITTDSKTLPDVNTAELLLSFIWVAVQYLLTFYCVALHWNLATGDQMKQNL